jgi:hypothetical protein
MGSRGSVVGIATAVYRYKKKVQISVAARDIFLFSKTSKLALEPIQSPT